MVKHLLFSVFLIAGCHYQIPGLDVGGDGGPSSGDGLIAVPDLAMCVAATCMDKVGPTGACCGGACVNTATDGKHCGGCGKACAAGATCCAGACVDLETSAEHCGACMSGCASGKCGKTIAATMQQKPSDWKFNGDAVHSGSVAVLTPDSGDQAGTAIYQNDIVTDEFTVEFEFQMVSGNADGMAFMITTSGNNAVGNDGGGLGVSGLAGYGVELDTWDNKECSDTNSNHVAVISLAKCGSKSPATLSPIADPMVDLNDDKWHKGRIELVKKKISVYVDMKKVIDQFDLGALNFTPGTKYFYGFGAGTGGWMDDQRHELRNVTITFPTARCL